MYTGRVETLILLIHKDISHRLITKLENNSESVCVKVFANKTSHSVASWYRPPDDTLEKMENFDLLFREKLDLSSIADTMD